MRDGADATRLDATRSTINRQHLDLIAALRATVALTQERLHTHLEADPGQDAPPGPFGRDGVATLLRTLVRSTDMLITRERSLLKLDGQGSDLGADDADAARERFIGQLGRLAAEADAAGLPVPPELL